MAGFGTSDGFRSWSVCFLSRRSGIRLPYWRLAKPEFRAVGFEDAVDFANTEENGGSEGTRKHSSVFGLVCVRLL